MSAREERLLGVRLVWSWIVLVFCSFLVAGCAARGVDLQQAMGFPPPEEVEPGSKAAQKRDPRQRGVPRGGWTERTVSEGEIQRICDNDPQLTPTACMEILARLNIIARYYIPEEMKSKRRMKVPDDFRTFKDWTPLPKQILAVRSLPKFILIVKDIPFLGWYEKGRMVGDTQICIGQEWGWTKKGLYRIEAKDADHVSGSYPNAYGEPAPMPLALRIYGRVWIHAGDVVGGFCSHGCINLPLTSAENLFRWAPVGTSVLVVDSLKELDGELKRSGVVKDKQERA